MRAMAMRILFRRKMSVKRMIASITDTIITEEEEEEKEEEEEEEDEEEDILFNHTPNSHVVQLWKKPQRYSIFVLMHIFYIYI